jgi:hypothetical protein
MAIQQPAAIAAKPKKLSVLLAGYPGIGKSTLALSAPAPLHIDTDLGIDRVPAPYRKPFVQPRDYDELKSDLVPDNLRDFETLVFDTGGQLFKLISRWAVKKDSKYGQRDGSLSLKGYGFVGHEFETLVNYCRYELQKHVVFVFHAKEDKDGDATRLRILIEGQTKDNIWQPIDLGGFVEIYNNARFLGLQNCERYFAKGGHGVTGQLPIPELRDGAPNDFLTRLFERYNANIAAETNGAEDEKAAYTTAMLTGLAIIGKIQTADDANAATEALNAIENALTSRDELRAAMNKKLNQLGLKYDKAAGVYVTV